MKRRKKRVRLLLLFIFICLICVCAFLAYNKLFYKDSKPVNDIKGYNYTIKKRDSKLMNENYELLKEVLLKKEIDYEKYAEYLSKLFVIDLYTINNKTNKYDVGGSEYVYPDNVNSYKLKVQDTLYKYLEDKSDRKQKLPVVSKIKLDSLEETSYEFNDKEYDAYEATLSWKYTNDLGYDDNATLILMKKDKHLYVVEFTPEVES